MAAKKKGSSAAKRANVAKTMEVDPNWLEPEINASNPRKSLAKTIEVDADWLENEDLGAKKKVPPPPIPEKEKSKTKK